MKRFVPIISALVVVVSLFAIPTFASAAGQQPWNYEDYIHNIDYEDGYNNVLVEIPSLASWLMVRHRNSAGKTLWQEQIYGTLLKGRWSPNYSEFDGYFCPIDSMKPLEVSNVPSGSSIRVQITLSGFNYEFDGFNMTIYYLGSDFQTLSVVRHWQDYQSHGVYEIDYEIAKPDGCKYICVQCPVSSIRSDTGGGDFQIEFTRTQLVMSIDALYMQQQITQKNNELLNKINDDLDNIANSEVTPSAPAGSDKVDDLGKLEDGLMDSAQDGLDQADAIFNDAPKIFALYASGFLFIATVLERFVSVGWISGILTVSLALGLVGFIVNIAVSVVGRGSSGGKGGKQ